MFASLVLAAALVAPPGGTPGAGVDAAPDVSVRAALLYNFAKFVEWPQLPAGAPLTFCFVGDARNALVFAQTIRDQRINGHPLAIVQPQESAAWRLCNVLFISDLESRRSAAGLDAISTLPVLTVSDGPGFAQGKGVVELYLEDGRMRFVINVDAAERSGLQVSSRLLGLAKVVRNPHAQ